MARALQLSAAVALGLISACAAHPGRGEPPADSLGEGVTSFYGKAFDGRKTANGEVFDHRALTAAHRTLPFGTCVLVRNLLNGHEVKVRVNDRGPFVKGRIIDVSEGAARRLGMIESGVAQVRLSRC